MNHAANSPEQLLQRYDLLCRALRARAEDDGAQAVAERLARLSTMIHHELIELARMGSPDDFADIYLGFTRELERFHEFCADLRLAQKTVVAFGGPFSAGKSSLINALLGQNLLVVEVDPTTALPAYLFAGEADVIHAINLHGQRITLSADELASLTHDERHRYGSEVGRALSAAFVTRQAFPWPHIAFVDTPGYTGGATAGDRTDANLALSQLNGAHAIVWVASIKQGDFTEEDLRFLARLDPAIPRFIAVSHADLVSEEDCAAVVARMQQTLAARNLPTLGVFPVSARPRYAALLEPLRQQIDAWNQPRQQRFAHRFKALFTRYQRGLEREKRDVLWQLHRINRLVTLAEGDLAADADELKAHVDARLDALKEVEGRLAALRSDFFAELKRIGDAVGIPLPEPHEFDLLEAGRSNLLEGLVALREKEGREEPDMRLALGALQNKGEAAHRLALIRRTSARQALGSLTSLVAPGEPAYRDSLLRRADQPLRDALAPLQR